MPRMPPCRCFLPLPHARHAHFPALTPLCSCLLSDAPSCRCLLPLPPASTEQEKDAGQQETILGFKIGQSRLDRAGARVLNAATKFGPMQADNAKEWIRTTRTSKEKDE